MLVFVRATVPVVEPDVNVTVPTLEPFFVIVMTLVPVGAPVHLARLRDTSKVVAFPAYSGPPTS